MNLPVLTEMVNLQTKLKIFKICIIFNSGRPLYILQLYSERIFILTL